GTDFFRFIRADGPASHSRGTAAVEVKGEEVVCGSPARGSEAHLDAPNCAALPWPFDLDQAAGSQGVSGWPGHGAGQATGPGEGEHSEGLGSVADADQDGEAAVLVQEGKLAWRRGGGVLVEAGRRGIWGLSKGAWKRLRYDN